MKSEQTEERDWLLAGNIQERVIRFMRDEEGFTILSSGHAQDAVRGSEIVAERDIDGTPTHRLVTVLGWPVPTHRRGALPASQDQPRLRSTRPEVTARNWLSQAVLDISLARGESPDVELSLALPAKASYIRYLQRLHWFLATTRTSIYLVSQTGGVATTTPGFAPTLGKGPGGRGRAITGTRRRLGLPGAGRLELPLLHALAQSGGELSRSDAVTLVARWFPEVPDPIPADFGQRVSMAHWYLQEAGLARLRSRGIWTITEEGRARHDAEWQEWQVKERAKRLIDTGEEPEVERDSRSPRTAK